jgi:hypothetical protein
LRAADYQKILAQGFELRWRSFAHSPATAVGVLLVGFAVSNKTKTKNKTNTKNSQTETFNELINE